MHRLATLSLTTPLLLFLPLALPTGEAAAQVYPSQVYPSRPLTMVVPYPAGGPTDAVARILAEGLRAPLGQPVVIENVTGAGGSLGVRRVARAAADGYTLSIGQLTSHVMSGAAYATNYDLLKDLEPVALLTSAPLWVIGRNGLPNTLQEVVAWLKANPDKASVGIAGVGATGHLAGISFQKETGTKFQFVPYRGNGPAMQDLLAEQIDFMIEPASNFKGLLAAGSVKPFAITGRARLPSLPKIPTADEAGLKGFFASLWYGLWVPKGVSKETVAKLNATMTQVFFDPQVRQRFDDLGIQISPIDQQAPDALRALQKSEAARWWPIIKASGIKVD
jgi:tripartite-type tricarboxylate transporter receptor subunit TctC